MNSGKCFRDARGGIEVGGLEISGLDGGLPVGVRCEARRWAGGGQK